MIFTRRFGALAARPQFPDAPELQDQQLPVDLDAELAALTAGGATRNDTRNDTLNDNRDDDRESAA